MQKIITLSVTNGYVDKPDSETLDAELARGAKIISAFPITGTPYGQLNIVVTTQVVYVLDCPELTEQELAEKELNELAHTLRNSTVGPARLKDYREALLENNNDLEEAKKWLRKRNLIR